MASTKIKKTKTASRKPSKSKEKIAHGVIHVQANFNNTQITITNKDGGKVLGKASAGCVGFKGSRKGMPHAAGLATRQAATKAKEYGLESVDIYLKGVGSGRDSAIRAAAEMFEIKFLTDVTPIPHNGPRARKARRV